MKALRMALIALLLTGCAHGQALRFAQGDVALCKHCNCYMPAHLAPDAPCSVCECHYPAAACYRGKHG